MISDSFKNCEEKLSISSKKSYVVQWGLGALDCAAFEGWHGADLCFPWNWCSWAAGSVSSMGAQGKGGVLWPWEPWKTISTLTLMTRALISSDSELPFYWLCWLYRKGAFCRKHLGQGSMKITLLVSHTQNNSSHRYWELTLWQALGRASCPPVLYIFKPLQGGWFGASSLSNASCFVIQRWRWQIISKWMRKNRI